MHPRDVRARTVDLHAARAQLRHRAGDVGTLEADEINALAALGEKSSDGLVRIGGLQQLDVADARRQDRVLEAEALRRVAPVHGEAEELREARRRRVQVAHDHRQLDDVAQHGHGILLDV